MHKIFLTAPEASIISGAEKIIHEFGGFPSMENGELHSICVQKSIFDFARYDISMVFDIEQWKRDSSMYTELPNSSLRFIELQFKRARSIQLNHPEMQHCREIKFDNTSDKSKRRQDSMPFRVPVINRPFCIFYVRTGNELVIEFAENECQISAIIRENL